MSLLIDIIHKGILSSIQDRGRFGYKHLAIPQSGWMDHHSAKLSNLLVGNTSNAPNIEMTLQSAKIRFHKDAIIAITGADMSFKIDDQAIKLNQAIKIKSGSTFSGSYAKRGLRSYLAISGDYTNINSDYNSFSTYPITKFGGINGQYLNNGDQLIIHQKEKTLIDIKLETTSLDAQAVRLTPGPEFHLLDNTSKQALIEGKFKISSNFSRMGAHLESTVKLSTASVLDSSIPVIPGTVQCLPDGQLIVLLQDGQTTGGYPRIAFIEEAPLNAFNQIRPGLNFSFYF